MPKKTPDHRATRTSSSTSPKSSPTTATRPVPRPASRKRFPSSKRKSPISSRWTWKCPDEWGPRFYRKMTMNPAFRDMPVIVISGLQGIHLAIRNAVATLQKPFDPEELISIVNRVLESKDAARKAWMGITVSVPAGSPRTAGNRG